MIQRTFGVADGSCGMLRCKRESLIPDTAADKKLNAAADEAVDADKGRDTAADKKFNAAADEAVDVDKEQDAAAGKQPNAATEPSMLIKDQITRRTKLGGWIGVG